MSTIANRASPTLGGAVGYFVVTMWALPQGHLDPQFVAEAVVMAGIVCTNILMETRAFFSWVGSLFSRKDKEK